MQKKRNNSNNRHCPTNRENGIVSQIFCLSVIDFPVIQCIKSLMLVPTATHQCVYNMMTNLLVPHQRRRWRRGMCWRRYYLRCRRCAWAERLVLIERGTEVVISNNCEVNVRPHMEVVQSKAWIKVNSEHMRGIIMNNAYNKYNRQIISWIVKA